MGEQMTSRTTRIVLVVFGVLAYAIIARFIHVRFVMSTNAIGVTSMDYYLLSAYVVLSGVLLVYAYRSVVANRRNAQDWGLSISGRAWYSIPILAVVVGAELWGRKTQLSVSYSQAILATLVLLTSSIFLRAFLMRLMSEQFRRDKAAPWIVVTVTGILFTLIHPNEHATMLGDIVSNCLSSSFILITGSVLAAFVYDAVRLLNPPLEQAIVLIPLSGIVIYVVAAGLARFAERKSGDRQNRGEA
jgi:heme/copper-type cytochrome/quinol oxidase subunit 3